MRGAHVTDKEGLARRLLGHAGGFYGERDGIIASIDGVGTKALLASSRADFEVLGWDAIAANVNDVLVGGEPLFALDYVGLSRADWRLDAIVLGARLACHNVGIPLVGGETAEMPDVYGEHVSVIGTVIGRAVSIESPPQPGHVVLGLDASGPHANGFTAIRRAAGERAKEWFRPTRLYAAPVRATRPYVSARANITGGGLKANVLRALGGFDVDWMLGAPPTWYERLRDDLHADTTDLNEGIGFVLVAAHEHLPAIAAALRQAGWDLPRILGYVKLGGTE